MIYYVSMLCAEEGTLGVFGKHLSQPLETEFCSCQLTIFHVNVRTKCFSDATDYH